MAAVDEPKKELQVGHEAAHRHGPGDDALAALPHDEDDSAGHDRGIDRLQPTSQSDELQTPPGEALARGRPPAGPRHWPSRRGAGRGCPTRLLEGRRQVGVGLTNGRGAAGDPPPGGMGQQHGQRHRDEGQQGQPCVDDEHRDDEGQREQEGVPDLDGELAHADAQHLDVRHDARHQVPHRRPLQVGHGPRQHPAEGVGPHVGPDAGVGGHEPPPLAHARHFGEEGAAQERQGRPARHRRSWPARDRRPAPGRWPDPARWPAGRPRCS